MNDLIEWLLYKAYHRIIPTKKKRIIIEFQKFMIL